MDKPKKVDAILTGQKRDGTLTAYLSGRDRVSANTMKAGVPFLEGVGGMSQSMAADLSFFFMFCGLSLLLGVFFGRFKLINILINAYIALAFIAVLPADLYLASPYAKAGVFLALLIVLTAIDKRLFDLHISSAGTDLFWRLIVMSLLVSGMLSSILLSLIPRSLTIGLISPQIFSVFAAPLTSVLWVAVPILALLFINNRLK